MQGNRMVVCVATVLCLVLNFGQIFGIPLDTQELAQLGELSDTNPLDSEITEDAQNVWHWPATAPVLKRETHPQNQPPPAQSSSANGTEIGSEPSNRSSIAIVPINEMQPVSKEFPNQPNAVTTLPDVSVRNPAASQTPPSNQAVENVIQPVIEVPAIVPQAGETTAPPASPALVTGSTKASDAADSNHISNLPPSAITPWYVAPPEVTGASPDLQQTSTGNVSSSTIVQPIIYLTLSCYFVTQFLL